MRRGQKHQRREKQAQHLENSEELSHSAVAAVLSDGERPSGAAHPAEHACDLPSLTPEAGGKIFELQSLLLCSNRCLDKCRHMYRVSEAPLRPAM